MIVSFARVLLIASKIFEGGPAGRDLQRLRRRGIGQLRRRGDVHELHGPGEGEGCGSGGREGERGGAEGVAWRQRSPGFVDCVCTRRPARL